MADDNYDIDLKLAKEIQDHSKQLRADYGGRDENNINLEDMFMLRWKGAKSFEEKAHGVKATTSQTPRVKVLGAERMIKTTDAQFRMKKEDQPGEGYSLDKMEKMANVLWKQSSRLRGNPLHYDIVRSALVFDEICIGVNCTKDIMDGMKAKLGKTGNARKDKRIELQLKRLEEVNKNVPYTFEAYHPSTCYPTWDAYGLKHLLRVYKITIQELVEQFGEGCLSRYELSDRDRYDTVEIEDWNDLQYRQMGITGRELPLMQLDVKLPFLPFVMEVVEGGLLHGSQADRRQSFLYTLLSTNIWYNDSLAKSILWKNVFEFGGTTKQIFTPAVDTPDARPEADFDADLPIVVKPPGSEMKEMEFQAIPPELQQAISIAAQEMESATIYSTSMGQGMGGQAAYSMIALLNMVGRQALTSVVQKCNWAIADAGKIALKWMKYNKKKAKGKYAGDTVVLEPKEIPDDFELECMLELDLAQDKLQMSQMALNLNQAGLNDRAWIREEIQGIQDSDAVEERIIMERTIDLLIQQDIQDALEKRRMEQAQQQMPQGVTGPGTSGAVPGSPQEAPPPQMTPEDMSGQPQPRQPLPVAGQNMGGY
jgi:hypothetical protein